MNTLKAAITENEYEILKNIIPNKKPAVVNHNKQHTIKSNHSNLVFLDDETVEEIGSDLLRTFADTPFEIIHKTSKNQFAIDTGKLLTALKELDSNRSKSPLKNRIVIASKRITLPTNYGLKIVQIDSIIQACARGSYTNFFMKDLGEILVCKNIKEYEELLPSPPFFRVHHSHLVNTDHVVNYLKGRGGQIEMINGQFINVARNKKNDLINMLTF